MNIIGGWKITGSYGPPSRDSGILRHGIQRSPGGRKRRVRHRGSYRILCVRMLGTPAVEAKRSMTTPPSHLIHLHPPSPARNVLAQATCWALKALPHKNRNTRGRGHKLSEMGPRESSNRNLHPGMADLTVIR